MGREREARYERNRGYVDHRLVGYQEHSPPNASSFSPGAGAGFIEHRVSKYDTPVGIAIKYGVEVSDIKRINGLVTDHQMFALESLKIPLPGRHPPSPCLSNAASTPGQSNDKTRDYHLHCKPIDSFQFLNSKSPQRKVSPAMSTLQGYYGLKPADQEITFEGCEMETYSKRDPILQEDGLYRTPFPASNKPLSRHRKSRSLVNDLLDQNGGFAENVSVTEDGENDNEKSNEKLVRRRQKSVADFSRTQEVLLKDENGNVGGFSMIKGKGLAQRQKTSSRTALTSDAELGGLNPIPFVNAESHLANGFSRVRKSSSTPSLQDEENSCSSSIWPTSKWSLKSDCQARSIAPAPRPNSTSWKKTAVD
ncbi:Peptidoglycan-binding LysM domain-containing protein putative isoform 1 [Tripterygium wilfordii]|uniref:Peptidoglycan-binding LysM domain-containing protein putative isoform 1 n=2 Tax=Tripterygium wilfordii TaxID=458696 RepID=A0A7J7DU85_TRIWF|nr:Peptidoglycan-binding LysM domain-containing protein putative isoform 1 [Tripterygium wilfordii]